MSDHLCSCGLSMSMNPHPEAGKPASLLEVGAMMVCIPCTIKSRHKVTQRAYKLEAMIGCVVASSWRATGRMSLPLWSVVRDLLCVGSTTAGEICEQHGFDPHQNISRRRPPKRREAK